MTMSPQSSVRGSDKEKRLSELNELTVGDQDSFDRARNVGLDTREELEDFEHVVLGQLHLLGSPRCPGPISSTGLPGTAPIQCGLDRAWLRGSRRKRQPAVSR